MPIFVGAGTSSFLKDNDGVGISQRSSTQINSMTGMVAGQIVYDTDSNVVKYYDGTDWLKISSLVPTLTNVTGQIFAGLTSTLTLTGTNFLTANLVVNFTQISDGIDVNVTVTPASDTSASVIVPSSVFNSVTAGNVVTIKVTNSDFVASNTQNITAAALPSGGTTTTSGGYTYHTFTSTGNFVNTLSSLSVEFLLVAGGGGGGSGDDGFGGGTGGGAGGAIDGTATLNAGTFQAVIGAGGGGGKRTAVAGSNGGDSTFNGNTAVGGGRGSDAGTTHPGGVGSGGDIPNGFSGGSGAGGFRAGNPGAGTAGQGNAGGYGGSYNVGSPDAAGGGGGGGKGSVGGNAGAGNGTAGNGGSGINWKSLGTTYAGGGGGGGDDSGSGTGTRGTGTDGGGDGTNAGTQSNNSNHAPANRGGGGGGTGANVGSNVYYQGSNGGSGVCIIRYQL